MDKITQSKTRAQMAYELGISRKTFYNWLKREGIELDRRLITPKQQKYIYEKLGINPNSD